MPVYTGNHVVNTAIDVELMDYQLCLSLALADSTKLLSKVLIPT